MAVDGPLAPVWRRAERGCPGISDLDFLGNLECILDFDAKVPNGALDLGVPEQ